MLTEPHDAPRADERRRMVEAQLAARGVRDPAVLAAMTAVPRHRFVPDDVLPYAYDDTPLSIASGQTISQPYIVAAMTELARVRPGSRVLEVGTGSGYQCAVLAAMGAEVWSIEIHPELTAAAARVLRELGVGEDRVHLRVGDGWAGWPEAAPFDAIVVTAAPPLVPPALLAQLAVGGRLVIPVGVDDQELLLVTRDGPARYREETVFPVRFVPMTGAAQRAT
ncbi:MAG: protein-L-isoaspartate(D-aspartate) O-methyltransferase [Kofleriaceae bacterium]|nr:protein-L-isoaspartate(D-aspartate) O-methyltransferase [Kofleriaceae bacterium]